MSRDNHGTDGRSHEVSPVMAHRTQRSAGFTLVEVTIALVLFALVIGSIYEIYVRGEKSQQIGIELAEANQNARSGVDLIARELRSAGYGVNPATQPSIVIGSQYRVTFALDMNGNRQIDMGEVITYFLDPNTSDPLIANSSNPYDFVLRRVVGTAGDSIPVPQAGHGEIVAYGLTQRTADNITAKNVPLFSYRNAGGTSLELKSGTANDAAGAFYGKTVSDADLGKPPGPTSVSQVKSIVVNMVTETKQKNVQTGSYDRVAISTSVEPRNFPYLAQANQLAPANTGATGTGTGSGSGTGSGTGTGTATASGTGTGTATGTGTGTGLPPSQPPIHIPTDKVLALALGDLDEDDGQEGSATTTDNQHDVDIVVGTRASGIANIRVWWNGQPNRYSGNVWFRQTESYLGNASYDIPVLAIANIDSSAVENRDVITGVASGTNTGRIQVWQNQALGYAGETHGKVGTTTTPCAPNNQYYDNPGTGEVRGLAIGDLNGDGLLDVAIGTKTATNAGKIEVWWGDGGGHYAHTAALDVYAASGEVRSVQIRDMNADGFPDIIAGTKTNTADTNGNIDIFFSNGLLTRRFTTTYSVATGGSVYMIAVGRMDNDSYPDVVTAIRTGNVTGKIEFWHNNATMIGALSRRDEQATPGPAISVAVGPIDWPNGFNDIVVGTSGAGGATPPAVQIFFCDPAATGGAIIPNLFSWCDANAGGAVNAVAVAKLQCSMDTPDTDQLFDVVAGTATSASTGDLVIYMNPYASLIVP
jgi:prepilin-type N-terminal cleavage/methylation domain-containing protein